MLIKRTIFPFSMVRGFSRVKLLLTGEYKYFDPQVGFFERLWFWKRGFYSWGKRLYGLNSENLLLYMDDRNYGLLHPINGKYSVLLDNKAFLPLIVDATTDVHVVFEQGVERYRKGVGPGAIGSALVEYMKLSGKELISKPLQSSGGVGLKVLTGVAVESFINGLIENKESLLIQEKVIPQEYSSRIFPGTVNTIRLVLYRNYTTGKMALANAAHRFGTSESAPGDNAGRGGLFTQIDAESGRLGRSFVALNMKNGGWHDVHPETGAEIRGVFIPDWHSRVRAIVELFDNLQWFDYGGLDIVFTDGGFVVIEINSLPALSSQFSRPLLAEGSVRDFFERKRRITGPARP